MITIHPVPHPDELICPVSGQHISGFYTARNKAQGALLTSDIEKFMTLKQTEIKKIAQAHSWKVSDIKQLINHSSNYWSTQAPSLTNALTHKKMLELDEGKTNGFISLPSLIYFCTGREVDDKATLAEIQHTKDNNPLFQNLMKEGCKDALNQLILH